MDAHTLAAVIAISLVFGGTIFGLFKTKTRGFGKFTTSVLLLLLALFVVTLAFFLGKIEAQPFVSVIFAVVGYGGGLVVGKANSDPESSIRAGRQ